MSDKIYKIGIFGPSGSGKGTQKDLLGGKLNLPSVSAGELLRVAGQERGARGQSIQKSLDQGLHVENIITNELVFEWLNQNGQGGYIIEGYPRNREQFDYFEARDHFTHVFVLQISDEEVVIRLTGRRVCACGRTYHLTYSPPKHDEICDLCGTKLQIRSDSTPAATRERIRLYHEELVPLIDEYKKQGIAHIIDGTQTIERVHEDIMQIFTS